MAYTRISMDTPNEVLWAHSDARQIERIMKDRPTPNNERQNLRRTRNGNLVLAVKR